MIYLFAFILFILKEVKLLHLTQCRMSRGQTSTHQPYKTYSRTQPFNKLVNNVFLFTNVILVHEGSIP